MHIHNELSLLIIKYMKQGTGVSSDTWKHSIPYTRHSMHKTPDLGSQASDSNCFDQ